MTANFEPGDVVDIVIKGARVFSRPDPEDEPGEGFDTFELTDGDRRELMSLNLSYPQITVARQAPKPTTAETVEARDIAELRQHVETLAVALSWWSTRDDSKPQPEVREYANLAVSTIDALSRLLGQTRSRLLGEMRQSDDAAMVRTEKLLAQFERRTQCASTLELGADHVHRCALYVDAGPHTDSNHICECGKQWNGGAL